MEIYGGTYFRDSKVERDCKTGLYKIAKETVAGVTVICVSQGFRVSRTQSSLGTGADPDFLKGGHRERKANSVVDL